MALYTPEQQAAIDATLNKRKTDTSIPGGMTDAQRMPAPATASNAPATPYGVPQSPKPATPMPMAYTNSANAINTPNMPTQGYGGADYNNSDWATKQSIQDNDARLASDSAYRDSEKIRAEGVMSGLMKSGDNVSEQQAYLAKIKGMMPQQHLTVTASPTQPTAQPTPQATAAPYGQLSPDRINAEAAAQIAKQIAERTRIANQTKAGYQTSFDRMKQTTGEDRTLQDSAFQRNANPFSGKTSYDKGITNLQRERTDRENQQDLQTRLGGVDAQLNDFLTQTPEQQQQIINDLTRQEREYGLQVGTLTGNLQGYGRTLAGSAQDANFTGIYNGQQTLQAQNQAFNQAMASKDANWNAYKDAVGMTGNLGTGPKTDWGQLPGQQGPASYQSVQDALKNGMSQQQIDNAASQFAQQMGYNYANMNANDKQAWAQIAISQQNAATSSSNAAWAKDPNNPDNIYKNAQIDQLKNPQPKTTGNYNLDDYKGYINQNFYKEQPIPGGSFGQTQKVLDTTSARNYIIGLGLPDDQTDQILKLYGLPTN